jgi:GNAT superfamily N-acetyltransferase
MSAPVTKCARWVPNSAPPVSRRLPHPTRTPNRFGQTFLDPDGYRIVIAEASTEDVQAARLDPPPLEMHWHDGSRNEIRPLFELAEDSKAQLDDYLDQGRVLVATRGSAIIGHLQLVPTTRAGQVELKNMAVVPEQQGSGIGRALVVAAARRCAAEGWSEMLVGTAAADIGNLRFYQRQGFRMLSIDRDAFTAATGYPDPTVIDGVVLRDRVWLERNLHVPDN